MGDISRVVSVLVVTSALAACAADYRDVSDAPDVRALRGVMCNTRVPLIQHGVVAYGNTRRDGISYFFLTPLPGFGGGEVLSKRDIPAGYQLKVLSIRECANCLAFGAGRLELEVQLDSAQSPFPIYLPGSFVDVEVVHRSARGYVFNPSVCG